MPWAIFNRPSIQLASLSGYLRQKSNYQVELFHPYLAVANCLGTDLYPKIALSGWAGEALFAPLLYPEKRDDAAKLFYTSLPSVNHKKVDFNALTEQVEHCCQNLLENIDFKRYGLFGFSICFSQLFPSLYLAKLIKSRQPDLPIVIGGSSCSGEVGTSLIKQYDQVDFVIDGEGEARLLNLCNFLTHTETRLAAGIHSRRPVTENTLSVTPLAISTLPYPDYRPYLSEIQKSFARQPFIPILPLEFSRGCWWNRCTFCNLNIQWSNYRFKDSGRMVEEVLALAERYESLQFTFTDNALPPKEADLFFAAIKEMSLDFDFFAEIRATAKIERLKTYRKGGLTTVQVGIEALSTSLLNKMDKGSTTMDNIAMMKLCAEHDIKLEGNLIAEFPSTSSTEIEETLRNLDYVLPFAPLTVATFFLGYGSPIYKELEKYCIKTTLPHDKAKLLFPKDTLNSLTMLIFSYRGDKKKQQQSWKPVRKMVATWQDFHNNRPDKARPALSYRDGGKFLIIRQEKLSGKTLHHRLRGLSRKIYLSAQVPTQMTDIRACFPQIPHDTLAAFIDEMCLKRLMFQENGRILSLAVQQH
jgi:ribosomal peptide maturation radical SAM protein 1